MKYTRKSGFIVPEHLSNFHDHILVVMVLWHIYSLMLYMLLFLKLMS